MYNINHISQINEKYVFFNDGVKEDRKVLNFSHILTAKEDLQEEVYHLNYMTTMINEKLDKIMTQVKQQKHLVKVAEKYIADNQNIPMVRRGMSLYHDNLNLASDKLFSLGGQLTGVNSLYCDCLAKREKFLKLLRQIDTVENR